MTPTTTTHQIGRPHRHHRPVGRPIQVTFTGAGRNYLCQNSHAYLCQLTMKGPDIRFVPFLLTHLSCIYPFVVSWEHWAFPWLVKTLPVQLRLCRFSTSFPMNCVTMKFVTHSKEVCQRLGACSVICVKLWIKAVSWPASCNRSVHQAIHFNWICGNNAHVRTESLFRSTLSITTA